MAFSFSFAWRFLVWTNTEWIMRLLEEKKFFFLMHNLHTLSLLFVPVSCVSNPFLHLLLSISKSSSPRTAIRYINFPSKSHTKLSNFIFIDFSTYDWFSSENFISLCMCVWGKGKLAFYSPNNHVGVLTFEALFIALLLNKSWGSPSSEKSKQIGTFTYKVKYISLYLLFFFSFVQCIFA